MQEQYTKKDTIEKLNILIQKLKKYRIGELLILDTALKIELNRREK